MAVVLLSAPQRHAKVVINPFQIVQRPPPGLRSGLHIRNPHPARQVFGPDSIEMASIAIHIDTIGNRTTPYLVAHCV